MTERAGIVPTAVVPWTDDEAGGVRESQIPADCTVYEAGVEPAVHNIQRGARGADLRCMRERARGVNSYTGGTGYVIAIGHLQSGGFDVQIGRVFANCLSQQ